jgi:hypothetical protein
VGKKGHFERAREAQQRERARQKPRVEPPPKPRPGLGSPNRKVKVEEVKERVAKKRASQKK